jgi:DNA-binding SARP family transcriptional activator
MEGALRIRLLGGFEVEGLAPAALGSRKARTLLKRLAVEAGSPVAVDALVDALWPDATDPDNQLAVLVSRLRKVLGSERLVRGDAGYQLRVDWLDLTELAERVAAAEQRLEGSPTAARAAALAAVTLARGDLLPEEPDADWARAPRAAARRLVARARAVGAEAALRAGRPAEAVETAAAALDADPFDEVALRLLMRGHLAAGAPARALAEYAVAAQRIADELGVDLDPETRRLHVEVLAATQAPAPGVKRSAAVELVGRAAELAELTGAFDRARQGALLVAVEGEGGIGKTRLLQALADALAAQAEVLWTTAVAERALPLEPVLQAVAAILTGSMPEERAALLGEEASMLEPLLLPGDSAARPGYRDIVSQLEPSSAAAAALHLALLAVLTRIARRRPLLLVIDDAHLCDAATLAWLSLLTRRGHGLPLLVCLALRPAEGAALPAVAERLPLGPLDAAATAELVGADRAAELFERSGGHPLFLTELAQADDGALPTSITQAVTERVEAAGEAAGTLRAAAVLGLDLDVDLLAGVLERKPTELLDHLEEGAARRLLEDSPSGYVFRHALVREALLASTPVARRVWLHREAARILSGRPDADPLAVAGHARQAGDRPRAAAALRQAADLAGVRFEHAEALRLADASLEQHDCAEGWLLRARALLMLQRNEEARVAAETAYGAGAGAAALEMAAHAVYYERDLDAAVLLADQASAQAEDPQIRATCALLAARALHARGHLRDAEQRLDPLVADAAAPAASRAFASVWIGLLDLHKGDVARAGTDLAEFALADRAPLPFAPLYVAQVRIHHLVLAGRAEQVLALANRWEQQVEAHGARRFLGRAGVYRGWALSTLADPGARDGLEAACELARSVGNREPLGQGSLDLADLALREGRLDDAARWLEVAEPIGHDAEVSNAWRIDLRRRYLAGRLAFEYGDTALARDHAAAVLARCESLDIERYAVLARLLDAHARARSGERISAEDLSDDLARLPTVAAPESWRVAGALARELGSTSVRTMGEQWLAQLIETAPRHADALTAAGAKLLG